MSRVTFNSDTNCHDRWEFDYEDIRHAANRVSVRILRYFNHHPPRPQASRNRTGSVQDWEEAALRYCGPRRLGHGAARAAHGRTGMSSLDQALATAVRAELRAFLSDELGPALAGVLAGQPPQREVFTLREACSVLNLSEPTVRELVRTGQLRWVDDGVQSRRITRQCVEAYLARNSAGAQHV